MNTVPPSIAAEIQDGVQQFLLVHEQLVLVLRAETEALQALDIKFISEIFERKGQLIEIYQGELRFLQQRRDHLRDILTPEQKQLLTEKREEMAQITEENLQALQRSQNSAQRVVSLIVDAAKDSKRTSNFYGRSGGIVEDHNLARSVTIDRSA